jgi:hypothetical protein
LASSHSLTRNQRRRLETFLPAIATRLLLSDQQDQPVAAGDVPEKVPVARSNLSHEGSGEPLAKIALQVTHYQNMAVAGFAILFPPDFNRDGDNIVVVAGRRR